MGEHVDKCLCIFRVAENEEMSCFKAWGMGWLVEDLALDDFKGWDFDGGVGGGFSKCYHGVVQFDSCRRPVGVVLVTKQE